MDPVLKLVEFLKGATIFKSQKFIWQKMDLLDQLARTRVDLDFINFIYMMMKSMLFMNLFVGLGS